MSDLRILETITPSRIGGAEVFVADLCESLPKLGAQVELFCPSGRPFVEYVRGRGTEPITWRTRGKFDPITVLRLLRLVRRGNFHLVHTHLSTASLLGAFAAKLAHRPSVAHVHGLNTATCFRYSTRIVAVSEAVKRHLVAQGIKGQRITVVHNGADLARFCPVGAGEAKRRAGFNPGEPVVGVFGRLSEEKGQRTAVEAMFLIRREHPDAKLLLAGEGKMRQELEESIQALGMTDSVHLAGFVDDVPGLMSACDVVVVPSLKEGFGLAAVEAMALERPVVASMVGGLSEIVSQRETGILVEPQDPKALADAVCDLISDSGAARQMGRRGRERATDCFDLDKQMRALLNVLREVGRPSL